MVATNGRPASYNCATNQVITINSFISRAKTGLVTISFGNGPKLEYLRPYPYGEGNPGSSFYVTHDIAVFTGVTNILVEDPVGYLLALTFTITTPTPQSSVPVNTVVIPSDATGPVQIVLESSSDLLNWCSALPGTYGSTYSNRFFRVRAIAQ